LVLWDPSYTRRLWCVFELAAFLHSHKHEAKSKLTIRPTTQGPFNVLLMLAVSLQVILIGLVPDRHKAVLLTSQLTIFIIGVYVFSATYRSYCYSLFLLSKELEHFRMEDTKAYCCDVNHEGILCDRQVISRCIRTWFGSTEQFEKVVRTDVLDILTTELSTRFFSYKMCIISGMPAAWAFMDSSAAALEAGAFQYGDRPDLPPEEVRRGITWWNARSVQELVRGAGWWLGVVPVLLLVMLRAACALRTRRQGCLNVLANLATLLAGAVVFMAALMLEQACFFFASDLLDRSSIR